MKTTVINEYILLYNSIYSTRFYVVMWNQILYFLPDLLIPLLLFTNKERSSSKRGMEGGIADETSMPPFKCECFIGSATQGQPPSWVHTGLTASTMSVKSHTKHKNRRSLYTARPPATKSPLLLMTNQNTTSPALPTPKPTS